MLHLPTKVDQCPQSQASLTDQLKVLHVAAARLGLYDAADWLWKVAIDKEPERTTGRGDIRCNCVEGSLTGGEHHEQHCPVQVIKDVA